MRPVAPLLTLAVAAAALGGDIPLDPRPTYLRLNDDPAPAATPIDLASIGVAPGQYVRLRSFGDFDNGPQGDTFDSLIAVFSSTPELLPSGNQHRVPGAIDAGFEFQSADTWRGGLPTDISEDFAITYGADIRSVMIRVPAGAAFLFVAPHDSLYYDNTDPDGDYGLRFEVVTCPADINQDGAVNTLDFISFLNLWNARERPADYDSNGVINTVDVITFLNLWTAGC